MSMRHEIVEVQQHGFHDGITEVHFPWAESMISFSHDNFLFA